MRSCISMGGRKLPAVRSSHGHAAARAAPASGVTVSATPTQVVHKPKVSMVSLGCPKNTVDSAQLDPWMWTDKFAGEVMLGHLRRSGFDIEDDPEASDAIIINTCTFVEDAKSESLNTIFDAVDICADGTKSKRLIVTGCMAQRYQEELAAEIPEVDAFVGFERYAELPNMLRSVLAAEPQIQKAGPRAPEPGIAAPGRVHTGGVDVPFRPEWDRVRLTPAHTAYLRVAEGCNHACSFCAIPGFRGKFRSKALDSIVEEAKRLVADGVKEINLIAEDTNQYGMDRRDGTGLAQLMRELAKIEGLCWMRILYAYPSYFSEELIDEIATNEKVCKYIDMPLQHISNLTLLAMNRPPRDHTEALLHKLRARIPGLALRTTFICGFPGETQAQHQEVVDFCKSFRFDHMGAFMYSEEDGTPAADLPEQVSEEERESWRDELISLQQRIGEVRAGKLVGRTLQVLVDGEDDDGVMVGRTQYDAPDIDGQVLLTNSEDAGVPPLEAGQMRMVKITDSITFDLIGQPVS